MARTTSGRKAVELREYWRRQLPLPCPRCPGLITDETAWDVGHIVDHADGGTLTIENTRPEHRRCNRRAGGKRGYVGMRRAMGQPVPTARFAPAPRSWFE